ncbi:MAG: PilW family protein, partial [Gammaproteobacteria bacterium]
NTYVIAAENPAAVPAGNWNPALDPSLPVVAPAYAIPGSDVLVVRYTQGTPVYITGIASDTAPNFTVNAVSAPLITSGNLFLLTNCVSGIAMQASSGTTATNIVHAGPLDAITGVPQSFIGAQVVSPVTTVFYVGQGADGSPALFEATNNTGAGSAPTFTMQELVPGVENMQVMYGVDQTGALVPSIYDTADVVSAANQWNSVVSVRIALLLRSNTGAVPLPGVAPKYNLLGTSITAPIDTRLRRVFTATIGLRNRLP